MIKTTLPLTPMDMVDFFKNKEQLYLIDYESSVKNLTNPKFLLMYIANLGIKCNVDIISDELVVEYMQLNEFTTIINLQQIHANILYLAKFGEMLYPDNQSVTKDWCIEFAKTHNNILIHQIAFLNSIPLYMLTRYLATDDSPIGPLYDDIVTQTSDTQYPEIGYSVLTLFTLPEFLISYLHANVPLDQQIYFTRYFDDYMFNGSNIYNYVFNDKNTYADLFQLITDSEAGDQDSLSLLTSLLSHMQSIVDHHR